MPAASRHPEPAAVSPSGRPTAARPRALVLACALVGAEVLVLAASAVVGIVALAQGGDAGQVLFLVALALGAGLLLAASVRNLWAGRRRGRAPVLTAQVLAVVTAGSWWSAGGSPGVLVGGLVGVVVIAALLSPAVVALTSGPVDRAP